MRFQLYKKCVIVIVAQHGVRVHLFSLSKCCVFCRVFNKHVVLLDIWSTFELYPIHYSHYKLSLSKYDTRFIQINSNGFASSTGSGNIENQSSNNTTTKQMNTNQNETKIQIIMLSIFCSINIESNMFPKSCQKQRRQTNENTDTPENTHGLENVWDTQNTIRIGVKVEMFTNHLIVCRIVFRNFFPPNSEYDSVSLMGVCF